jgi:CDGSH-type Zn-finger protein/uncharacterized Fe-S cluster protein YjdI
VSDDIHSYEGPGVTVHWDKARCIHAGQCVRGLKDVFNPKQRPWIQPDRAEVERLTEVIGRCPSGALWYERQDGPTEAAPAVNAMRMEVNGPLHVHADLFIDGASPVGAGTRASLCRCGRSANMPYCDNSHIEAGFRHDGTAEAGELAAELAPGPLHITAIADGPLQVDGAVEIRDREGTPVLRATRCWLCRCGQSGNKPYCDGSHKAAGFTTG